MTAPTKLADEQKDNPMTAPTEIAELERLVDVALKARVPGGSEVWVWLPQQDAFTPSETARDVMRCAIKAALEARTPTDHSELIERVEAWEREWLSAGHTPHWGDGIEWGTAKEIARRLEALTARSDGWREGVEAAAMVAEQDNTPAYGPHRADMECLAEAQRQNIATAIRAITPPETTP